MHRSAELTLIDKTKDGILSQQLWQFEKPVLEVAAEKRLKIHCVDDEGEKKKITTVSLAKPNMLSWTNPLPVLSRRDKRHSHVVAAYPGKCNKMARRPVLAGCLTACAVNCNDAGLGSGEIISCFRFCLGHSGRCASVDQKATV